MTHTTPAPDDGPDEDDKTARMLTDIVLGRPKASSAAVVTEADSALWDRIAADVDAIPTGGVVDYGLRDEL